MLLTSVIPRSKDGGQEAKDKSYTERGKVLAADSAKSRVMIAREGIPGYMMAMTVPLRVKNLDLPGLAVGDSFTGDPKVTHKDSRLQDLTVFKKAGAPETVDSGVVRTGSER